MHPIEISRTIDIIVHSFGVLGVQVQARACMSLFVLAREKSNLKQIGILNKTEVGAERPCHVVIRALGKHAKITKIAIYAVRFPVAKLPFDLSPQSSHASA